jgi:hypothetical protein
MKTIDADREILGAGRGASKAAFAQATLGYKRATVRVLFIAEAPPAFRFNRLFYFENLREGDTLFLEMMKTLYASAVGFTENGFSRGSSAEGIRCRKSELLARFMREGYFLIDASEEPMPDRASSSQKLALLRVAAKRGGHAERVDLDELPDLSGDRSNQLIALEDALNALAAMDARKASVVELRFYGGLSVEESAAVLEISLRAPVSRTKSSSVRAASSPHLASSTMTRTASYLRPAASRTPLPA